MKPFFYFILISITLVFSFGCNNAGSDILGGIFNSEEETLPEDTIVWICKGPMSKSYHKSKNCRGLKSCSKDIDTISIARAESQGKRPCGSCVHGKNN